MENPSFITPARRLLACFRAWDVAAASEPGYDAQGLSRAERAALLDELASLVGAGARALPLAEAWEALWGRFGASGLEERARREADLLDAYERLCELDLPYQVKGVLLRHHGAIKRAAHVADACRHLPAPPRPASASPSPAAR